MFLLAVGRLFRMSAYGFEENYAKAWPEGAAPEKGIRRVQDCGKLNFVGILSS